MTEDQEDKMNHVLGPETVGYEDQEAEVVQVLQSLQQAVIAQQLQIDAMAEQFMQVLHYLNDLAEKDKTIITSPRDERWLG